MDGQGCVCDLYRNKMASGCTMQRRQAKEGSVIFCWKTLYPGIHVDDTYHLPKHYCRPDVHDNGVLQWQWPLSVG